MVITKTPFRISFFGGGTDIKEWYLENGGVVLSTTIDKYCYISCKYLPKFFNHDYRLVYSKIEEIKSINDIKHPSIKGVLEYFNWNRGIELHHEGDLPARSGLGSSSSFTVGLINTLNALQGKMTSKFDLANQSIYIEQELLKENVGCQDQIAAAFGGFNRIEFTKTNKFIVSPILISEKRLNELQDNLILFYTGISRFASEIEKLKIQNFNSKRNELKNMQELVPEAINILTNDYQNLDDFGNLLNLTWRLKKSLSTSVSNSEIDLIYDNAMKSGAIGGKLLGAGGGGFILFYAKKHTHQEIIKTLKGLIYVPFKFENNGSVVSLYQPNGL